MKKKPFLRNITHKPIRSPAPSCIFSSIFSSVLSFASSVILSSSFNPSRIFSSVLLLGRKSLSRVSITRAQTYSLILLLVLVLLPSAAAFSVNFDLGRVNYPDPVVGVLFNEPVQLVDAATDLTYLDTNTFIGLEFIGTGDGPYFYDHEILPSAGELKQGNYYLSVVGRNTLGLTNPVPATIGFEVTGLNMKLITPENGYSPVSPYTVTVQTYVLDGDAENETHIPFNAECKYLLGPAPALDDYNNPAWKPLTQTVPSQDPDQYVSPELGTLHTATGLVTPSSTFSVICQQYKKSGIPIPKPTVKEFTIGHLSQGPNITIQAIPERVVNLNTPWTELRVNTDQESTCTIANGPSSSLTNEIPLATSQTFNTTHGHIIRYDNDEGVNTDYRDDLAEHHHYYTITCVNRAGRESHRTINISINFGESLTITVIEPWTNITNKDPVEAIITTNLPALCTVNDLQMSADNTEHTRALMTQPHANYTAQFSCTFEDKSATTNVSFTTDRIPPTAPVIDSSGSICDGNATMTLTAEDNDRINKYYWQLWMNEELINNGTTPGGYVSIDVPSFSSQEYLWVTYAEDRAGNTGPEATKSIISRPGDSDECDPRPFINYHTPEKGWDTEPFTIRIATKRPASCGYLIELPGITSGTNYVPSASTDGITHTFFSMPTGFSNEHDVQVRCTEGDKEYERLMNFGMYTEDLLLTELIAEPNPVIDFQKKQSLITVKTNHDALCELSLTDTVPFDGEDPSIIETFTQDHSYLLDLSFITEPVTQTLDYVITCTDKAAQTKTEALPLTIDFLRAFDIEVLSPPRATNNQEVTLAIRPSMPASCIYRDMDSGINGGMNPMNENNGVSTATFSAVPEGAHTILVRCLNPTGVLAEQTVTFSVDLTPPDVILSNDPLCPQSQTTIFFETNEEITNTTIKVSSGTAVLYSGDVTTNTYVIHGENHTANQELAILGEGIDMAGNPFTTNTTIAVLSEYHPACDVGTIFCGNNITQPGEQCDGPSLGSATDCSLHGNNLEGTITFCTSECTYNFSTCDRTVTGTPISDCTDPGATNFNPLANTDDGTCLYGLDVSDCTDSSAHNWNPRATTDDGTCVFLPDNATDQPIPDCTDSSAVNWNPRATTDDGTCTYTYVVPDCMDSEANNYNPRATQDDGTCTYDNNQDTTPEDSTTGFIPPDTQPDSPDNSPSEPDENRPGGEQKAFSWLALILILSGFLLMTGSSYYLYVADKDRNVPVRTLPPVTPPPINRQQTVELLKQQQEAFRKRSEENVKERRKIASAFTEDTPENSSENSSKEAAQPQEKQQATTEAKAEKKTADVFDKLDEFIEETKENERK